MLAAFAVNAWLSDTSRLLAGSVFGLIVTLLVLASVWATAWAAATRRVDLAVPFSGSSRPAVSATLLGALVAAEITEWLTFLFPDAPLVFLLTGAAYLALAGARRRPPGRVGNAAAGSALARRRDGLGSDRALLLLATLAKDDTFSDTPELASALKPLSPAWIPAGDVDEFGGAIRKAQSEADDAMKEEHSP